MNPFKPAVLFALCDAGGISNAAIARVLGVNRSAVSNWKQGIREMSAAHQEALCRLAMSTETVWLTIHRQRTWQSPPDTPTSGASAHVYQAPEDYKQAMLQTFQVAIDHVYTLVAGDPADWDLESVFGAMEELGGMARALRIILSPLDDPALAGRLDNLKVELAEKGIR